MNESLNFFEPLYIPVKYRTKLFTGWLMTVIELMNIISQVIVVIQCMLDVSVIVSTEIICLYLRAQEEECCTHGKGPIARKGVFLPLFSLSKMF